MLLNKKLLEENWIADLKRAVEDGKNWKSYIRNIIYEKIGKINLFFTAVRSLVKVAQNLGLC